MLDSLLEQDIVKEFLYQLKNNERYYLKKSSFFTNVDFAPLASEIACYIFYDALYKYKIILDDKEMFSYYIEQIEKLYRKIDNFEDIRYGIHKLICQCLIEKNDIKNIDSYGERSIIINDIYNKYIENGYLFHGFSSCYYDKINNEGISVENYDNYYEELKKLNEIFRKYHLADAFIKDFDKKSISFTYDLVMGCFYSTHSPMFFSQFFNDEHFFSVSKKDYYLIRDYNHLEADVKKFMMLHLFEDDDQKEVLKIIKDEWNLLHSSIERICIASIKRKKYKDSILNIDDYLNTDENIFDLVDRMLVSKDSSVDIKEDIIKEDIQLINFDFDYSNIVIEKEIDNTDYLKLEEEVGQEFLDKYGGVSLLLLIGSVLIFLGVIISIILI